MTAGAFFYRDVRTGRLYMQTGGGNEPVEIDEAFAKMLSIDESSVKNIDPESGEEESTVICLNCGTAVKKARFCRECGNKLQ